MIPTLPHWAVWCVSLLHHVFLPVPKSDIFTPKTGHEYIYWARNQPLTWSDYQGAADYNHATIAALTSSGIAQWKDCKDGYIDYEVVACFDKNYSWVKPEAHTKYHLAHEQGHFDITEIYTRRLNKVLRAKVFRCDEADKFEKFVTIFLEEWERAQSQYDTDTEWSTNPPKQALWLERIKQEIDN